MSLNLLSENGQSSKYCLYQLQVSGKAPKFINEDGTVILKGLISQQTEFLEYINTLHASHLSYCVKKFIPKYYGPIRLSNVESIQFEEEQESSDNKEKTIWLKHLQSRFAVKNSDMMFIQMENLCFGYSMPNILDLKMGERSEKPHKITESVRQYKLKLNGMLKNSEGFKDEFRSKYELYKILDKEEIVRYLAWFFSIPSSSSSSPSSSSFSSSSSSQFNPQSLTKSLTKSLPQYNTQSLQPTLQPTPQPSPLIAFSQAQTEICTELVREMIEQLKKLTLALRSLEDWRFSSSSVIFIYDGANPRKNMVKWIDFGRAKFIGNSNQSCDTNLCAGVEILTHFLQQIWQDPETYRNLVMKVPSQETVPERKITKFNELIKKSK